MSGEGVSGRTGGGARLALRALAVTVAFLLAGCDPAPDATTPQPAARPASPAPDAPVTSSAPPVTEPVPDPAAPGPRDAPVPGHDAARPAPTFLPPGEVVASASGGEVATAVGLRAGSHSGFDRVVLELDRFPGTRVEWLDGQPIRCGSGEVASLPGRAFLEVRLEPAKAHDEAGALTLQSRELGPALPAIESVALTCDFEAVLTFAVGAPDRLPFRVSRLDGPPRLVIDVRHPDAPPGRRHPDGASPR